MRTFPHRAARTALAALLASAAVALGAGPAAAHAGVTASNPQAMATDVKLTFTSEAESATAGLARIHILLPPGLSRAAVVTDKLPKGWQLSFAEGGYVVTGKPLPVGTDAVHTVVIKQLPKAKQLVFKVLETYSDGKISRWIEEPGAGDTGDNPAPVLQLRPAAKGAKKIDLNIFQPPSVSPSAGGSPAASSAPPTPSTSPSAPASASPEPAASTSVRATQADPPGSATDESNSQSTGTGVLIGGAVAVVVVVGAGVWFLRRAGQRRT
ncbi:DUF1775 domain-containing protein [Streptomyces yaizuensis]|uniref:YncI copper-binding domain-containing protein n=1 Tax=Streptomyces yaizuensis TaxID=2989713 RepID=A0ABQ5P5K3_9ACTN|nr:DUF1775 domain-containing protein [Streptomyces sp. YSPA8]GLF97857.1 hypothetical protein SYYSPA8_26190 [Streptomyces sp. YSPA8]